MTNYRMGTVGVCVGMHKKFQFDFTDPLQNDWFIFNYTLAGWKKKKKKKQKTELQSGTAFSRFQSPYPGLEAIA